MNILFLIGSLKYSGAENVLREITPKIEKYNNRVSISTRTSSEEKEYKGIPILSYTEKSYMRILKLIKYIKNNNIDVIVGFGFPFSIDCIVLKILTGKKAVVCERHDPSSIKRTSKQKLLKKILYPFADRYVVQTNTTKEFYLRKFTKNKNKVFVINNPVIGLNRECVAGNDRNKEIVTVGRYDNFQKNHIMLINAFYKFSFVHPEYKLKLYGDGKDRKLYQNTINTLGLTDKVELCGYVNNPIEHIKNADIFCLSSDFEGMPNALIEAMSIGLPCISTDFGGGAAKELIKNNYNGIIIDKNGEEELLHALITLVENRKLNFELGNNAFKINKTLSVDKIVPQWIEAFTF